MASFLMVYAEYCNGYLQVVGIYREMRKNKKLLTFIDARQAETGQGLSLSDYLIMPVQRIPRYVLLLKVMRWLLLINDAKLLTIFLGIIEEYFFGSSRLC